jgi:hypothetical protein
MKDDSLKLFLLSIVSPISENSTKSEKSQAVFRNAAVSPEDENG